ncbi:MAG: hypothetical protein H7Z37_17135 [Pyrinomonadaceae bacterium]|nr:hypothetical protein [Pyrinomonadaceae bacterium]
MGLTRKIKRLFVVAMTAMFLCALFAPYYPIAAATFDESCKMPCCKGLARHRAQGCRDGFCHLRPRKTKIVKPDDFCGADKLENRRLALRTKLRDFSTSNSYLIDAKLFADNQNVAEDLPSPMLNFPMLKMNCGETVCLTASGSSGNQRTQTIDYAMVASIVTKPRPPNVVVAKSIFRLVPTKTRRAIRQKSNPRAPPIFLS